MKRIAVLLMATLLFAGCSQKRITEKEFALIWNEYLSREFIESFDEKQSIDQRQKIIMDILSENNFSFQDFEIFIKKHHADKYKKVFVE